MAAALQDLEQRIAALERGKHGGLGAMAAEEVFFAGVGDGSTSSTGSVQAPTSPVSIIPFTKLRDDTIVQATLHISYFSTVASVAAEWNLRAQSVNHFMMRTFQNESGIHQGWSAVKEIAGLTSGTFNFLLYWRSPSAVSLTMDLNDPVSIHLREVLR